MHSDVSRRIAGTLRGRRSATVRTHAAKLPCFPFWSATVFSMGSFGDFARRCMKVCCWPGLLVARNVTRKTPVFLVSKCPEGPRLPCPICPQRMGGLNFILETDFEWPVWRHRLQRNDECAAPASGCCVSKHPEGQRRHCPLHTSSNNAQRTVTASCVLFAFLITPICARSGRLGHAGDDHILRGGAYPQGPFSGIWRLRSGLLWCGVGLPRSALCPHWISAAPAGWRAKGEYRCGSIVLGGMECPSIFTLSGMVKLHD
ncbi:hypothetical protein PhaeoP23_03967 (plasmid) [Phaeobacter piscinae]|uniref:Uncharacterized protein n=1 Tax=Phaeobacter piscinae TaxID=1580596 RepID=A0ABN5DKV6_9RHOB|nr:hypothetical protein PhaeoP36_04045 [Phaeobacter piscinae]AUQ88641.1 hypothetical protein PhaeoP42_04046 [Phaeobacter piscinae]AUQ92640.1 hypothetical protein PhaeoP24_04082 [Phaeobacter inhibens]AUR26446.1 hypothetical protein PhaeoP23_03967 [Phaeobacter piscinae]